MSDIVERVKVALGYLPAIEPHRSLLAECKAEITRLRAQVAAADNPVATIIKRIKPDGSSSIKPELHVGVDLPIGTYLYVSPPAAPSPSDARDEAIRRMRKALDAIYNHNEACRAAVLEHYGNVHDFMEIDAASADKESGGG